MPGTLLDETEISRQFGVSRSPVREALIRLSAEGLVQNFRNRTAIVAQFDIATLPAYFDAMQLLYRLSCRLACHNPNPAKLEKLRRDHEEHERALRRRDIRNMVRLNRDFHMTIAEMTGNPYIADWISGILDQGQRLLGLYGMHLPDRVERRFPEVPPRDPRRDREEGSGCRGGGRPRRRAVADRRVHGTAWRIGPECGSASSSATDLHRCQGRARILS